MVLCIFFQKAYTHFLTQYLHYFILMCYLILCFSMNVWSVPFFHFFCTLITQNFTLFDTDVLHYCVTVSALYGPLHYLTQYLHYLILCYSMICYIFSFFSVHYLLKILYYLIQSWYIIVWYIRVWNILVIIWWIYLVLILTEWVVIGIQFLSNLNLDTVNVVICCA